jgi:GH24 family phage-related lysozyme (muramidase)
MGPNMYITPPAVFTHFHQDGHGTVDSGHLCINGYNEVVMLRRLTERHKKHALLILTGNRKAAGKERQRYFDGLYQEPHGDGLVSIFTELGGACVICRLGLTHL